MRYLLMCEGKNEETLINLLLNNDLLKITRDDLIGMRPWNVRQLKNSVIKTELRHYNQPVIIYRIGDTQKDHLKIPPDLNDIVFEEKIYRYCTKPELEILLIINEGLMTKYYKSKKRPKDFAKEHIKLNGMKYDQSSMFLWNYYRRDIMMLVDNLKEYRRMKKNKSNELYLADLLK